MKNPPDPSYDPDYAEECCMSCGARQERGDGGSCNRCNGDYDEGREKSAVARLGKIAAWGDVLKPTLMGAGIGAGLGAGAHGLRKLIGDKDSSLLSSLTVGGLGGAAAGSIYGGLGQATQNDVLRSTRDKALAEHLITDNIRKTFQVPAMDDVARLEQTHDSVLPLLRRSTKYAPIDETNMYEALQGSIADRVTGSGQYEISDYAKELLKRLIGREKGGGDKLEAEGVDVDHWNEESKGKAMPDFTPYAADTEFADDYDDTQLREALAERVRMIAQLRAHRDSLLDARSGYVPEKQANYSVVQNMAWVAAQEKVAHEKRANRWSKLLNAVVPAAKHEATQTGLGAGIGAATSPFVADHVGVETDVGRWGHRLSSAVAGAAIGNPRTRRSMTHSQPWTRKGALKVEREALTAFSRANPELNARQAINAYRKATGGRPVTKPNPIKTPAMVGGSLAVPSTFGFFLDPTKRFADKANDALADADVAGKEITSPSTLAANFAYNMADQYGYNKEWVNDMGRNIGINAGSSLMGGGLGGLLGGKLADMFSSVAIDEGDADYKNLDEAGYKKRRRKQKLKNLLWWAGHIGGGVAGASLGAKYLPDKLRQMFPKKANDMNNEIIRLARLSAEKQAGIGIKPEVSKRLMGGLTGGAVGAGIGAVGTAAIDPLMDKLFKSPEQQIQEKARTTFLERLKARLIAGAAVGGGIGVARGSGMKDMFQRT